VTGRRGPLPSAVLVFLLSSATAQASQAPAAPSLQAALERARETGLAGDRGWLRLLHYRGRPGHYESEADGPAFFLAAQGKTDPDAELSATVRSFFTPLTAAMEGARSARDRHPLCRFPARFLWLRSRLALAAADLPQPRCPELIDFVNRLHAQSVILVFSAYYLNNPASAFGHTFLRLRRGGPVGSDLLDYGVDFSADVDTTNAVFYAFKGLTGLFPGTFKRMPYYYKVREYNDYESRDLWEYELNLSPEALTMLVMHVWELAFTHFDYYYATENCSYHILGLLEAVDPELDLIDQLRVPVIPANTVKALFANRHLVRSVDFRPSVRTQFRRRVGGFDAARRDAVRSLALRPTATLPSDWSPETRSKVMDAALDYVDMKYGRALIANTSPAAADLRQSLMVRRATLGTGEADLSVPPPSEQQPERGHGSARVGTALGSTTGGELFQSFDMRLALHDLADPEAGYPRFAELEFLPTRLRWRMERQRLDLEDFALARVTSLTPLDPFDTHLSWTASLGAMTRTDDCAACVAGRVLLGMGGAVALGRPLTLFLTGDLEALYAPSGGWRFPFRAGVGPAAGLVMRVGPVTALARGDVRYYPRQPPSRLWHGRVVVRIPLRADCSLFAEAATQLRETNLRLGGLLYF
jgi:Domain of unknown function (DUF4105)